MSIADNWMVDLMIIYIEKTIAKALDINDIIIFYGDVSLMSPNLPMNNQILPPTVSTRLSCISMSRETCLEG
jgi:hypothetical protein